MSLRATQRACPEARRIFPTHSSVFAVVIDIVETSAGFGSFATTMKLEHESVSASDPNTMDRRVIRMDASPTHAGITAALRRAFEAAASEPCDRDFAELLRRLN
jgi:hypothetical protein